MQSNEYEYAQYEAQNEREDEALRIREREDETNPVTAAAAGWLASQRLAIRSERSKDKSRRVA